MVDSTLITKGFILAKQLYITTNRSAGIASNGYIIAKLIALTEQLKLISQNLENDEQK